MTISQIRQEWRETKHAMRVWWVWPLWFAAVAWVDMNGAYSVRMSLFGPFLALLLLLLTVVDLRTMTLPDLLTFLLVALGLGALAFGGGPGLIWSLAGGVLGFLSFWGIQWGSKRFTGKDGMGRGDAKLFGAIGVWVGVIGLPLVALVASLTALVWIGLKRPKRGKKIPFGPFLALGGWVVFLYQDWLWMILAMGTGHAGTF